MDSSGENIVVYLRNGGSATVNLSGLSGSSSPTVSVQWYDPRLGGALQDGSVSSLSYGSNNQSLGNAPYSSNKDWVALLKAAT